MSQALQLPSFELSPGAVLTLHDVTWDDYENLLEQKGEKSNPRTRFSNGSITLMSPSRLHEYLAEEIGLAIVLELDNAARDYVMTGSGTLKRKGLKGIEPDKSFFIDVPVERALNDESLPPSLCVEVDLTSSKPVSDYAVFQVPEVWVYKRNSLAIFRLSGTGYIEESYSQYVSAEAVDMLRAHMATIDPSV